VPLPAVAVTACRCRRRVPPLRAAAATATACRRSVPLPRAAAATATATATACRCRPPLPRTAAAARAAHRCRCASRPPLPPPPPPPRVAVLAGSPARRPRRRRPSPSAPVPRAARRALDPALLHQHLPTSKRSRPGNRGRPVPALGSCYRSRSSATSPLSSSDPSATRPRWPSLTWSYQVGIASIENLPSTHGTGSNVSS